MIERRRLPGTDLEVSVLCLGTMTFGTPVGEAEAIRMCHAAMELGINFIDTANSYEGYSRVVGSAGGQAESLLGAALAGRRDRVVLATKVGMKIGPLDSDRGLGRAHIRREIERSLQRLGTDYVDLYYLHAPDPQTPPAETVEAMHGLVREGKIRHWGVSNFSAAQLRELLVTCDRGSWLRPVVVQPPYSLLERGIEADLLPLCGEAGLGVVPYQVLQGGLLTGKYGDAVPVGSRLAEKPQWLRPLDEGMRARLTALEAEARARGRSLAGHALCELLARPAIASLIVGARESRQVAEMVALVQADAARGAA